MARVEGGVLPAARDLRPADWPDRDREALRPEDIPYFLGPVLEAARRTNATESLVREAIATAAGRLDGRRDQLITVVMSPGHALAAVHAARGRLHVEPSGPVATWRRMCWLVEIVAHRLSGTDEVGLRALRPLADRLRFLVLSEPLRHRADPAWRPTPGNPRDPLNSVFGESSWHVLTATCAEARRSWEGHLDSYRSRPFLARAPAEGLEAELLLLLFEDPATGREALSTAWRRPTGPIIDARGEPVRLSVPPTAEDMAVRAEVVERHLLPRFRLRWVIRLSSPGGPTARDPWRIVVLLTAAAAVATAVLGTLMSGVGLGPAAGMAAGSYALICAGALRHGSGWAAQWLLRFPAAAAFGLFTLMALPHGWWSSPSAGWKWIVAPAALAVASFGYLTVEVINHGVDGRRALGRAAGVFLTGAVHAFLMSLIVLVGVAGVYADAPSDGPGLLRQLHGSAAFAWQVLTLATCWSLTVGVFSQILWDDRPITASLAHLTWRDGDRS
ncbi:hypothetical protein [Streptomyces calidiresistens]|uniref:Uncharacterized protein n=1 Tax=Streptomyces calidiresistens TaxID=1485586 RepID=A0A7W3XV35_9ACTN|nr:hypothetical protein [Streptomyces calidiresistens]MBB0228322.1 hypothetical protein [Streptomyces calidiresistens]